MQPYAERRADSQCAIAGDTVPRDDPADITGTHRADAPKHCAGANKTLAKTKDNPPLAQ